MVDSNANARPVVVGRLSAKRGRICGKKTFLLRVQCPFCPWPHFHRWWLGHTRWETAPRSVRPRLRSHPLTECEVFRS